MSARDGYDADLIRRLDERAGGVLRAHGLAVTSDVHSAIRAAVVDCVLVADQHRREGTLEAEAPPVVRIGVGAGRPQVQGRCPACGGRSLFLANGGHVTCSRLDCGNPCAADEVLGDPPAARETARPVRELPTAPGSVVLGVAKRRAFTRSASGHWFYVDDSGHMGDVAAPFVDDDWVPARVVRDDDEGPVAALREVVRLLDGPQSEAAQEAQDVAKAALQRLAGEG